MGHCRCIEINMLVKTTGERSVTILKVAVKSQRNGKKSDTANPVHTGECLKNNSLVRKQRVTRSHSAVRSRAST